MATRGNTKLQGFYFPWPVRNKQFARQIDASRENTEKIAPLVRAAYVDPQPVTARDPGNHDLSGWAVGMRDFRNKYRIYYDQVNLRFAIQHNVGTEAVEVWDDVITMRESDGRVTIEQFGGLASPGGFYAPVPRNLAVSGRFALSGEWIFQHDLNTVPVFTQTFTLGDEQIHASKTDVSDPNIAYFYWNTPQAGTAMAVAEQARGEGIRISDGTNTFPGATRLNFSDVDFYLSNDGHGMPTVNLQQLDINNFDTSTLIKTNGSNPFIADQSMGGHKLTNVGTPVSGGDSVNKTYADALQLDVELTGGNHAFTDITKLVFDSQSFYFDTTSGGQPVVGIRGSLGGGTGNTSYAASFTASTEWQVNHSLNTADLNWSAYDDQGLAIIPSKVAVHDPNTAYFYFGTNAMTGRAVITAAGGVSAADLSPFIRKDGTITFTGDESMGGFKLTNVGTPTGATDAANKKYVDDSNGFYGLIFSDDVHVFKSDKLTFNSGSFYLDRDSRGRATVSLRYNRDYIPVFDEFPTVHNIVVEPFAPYGYTVESVTIDTKAGSLVGGFYVMTPATRNKNGIAITGLDPINVSSTLQTLTPSANNSINRGDMIVFSINSVTTPKHLRMQITARKP